MPVLLHKSLLSFLLMVAVLSKTYPGGDMTDDQIKEYMQAIDKDGDAKISLAEILAYTIDDDDDPHHSPEAKASEHSAKMRAYITEIFPAEDTNSDGFIDKTELSYFLSMIHTYELLVGEDEL